MELNSAYQNYCKKYQDITQELWNEIEEINKSNVQQILNSQEQIKNLEEQIKERDETIKLGKHRQSKLKEELENFKSPSTSKSLALTHRPSGSPRTMQR